MIGFKTTKAEKIACDGHFLTFDTAAGPDVNNSNAAFNVSSPQLARASKRASLNDMSVFGNLIRASTYSDIDGKSPGLIDIVDFADVCDVNDLRCIINLHVWCVILLLHCRVAACATIRCTALIALISSALPYHMNA